MHCFLLNMQSIQRVAPLWVSSPLKPPVTEAIINLQALLVKSYLLNALLITRKAFPIGYHGAPVLRPASATRRDLTRSGRCGRATIRPGRADTLRHRALAACKKAEANTQYPGCGYHHFCGFQSRASLCASVICAAVIFAASSSRSSTAPSAPFAAARFNHW